MSVRRAALGLLAVAGHALACASPNLDRDMRYTEPNEGSGPLIEVQAFERTGSVPSYDAPSHWLEVEIGQRLVRHLRRRGRRALLAAGDAPARGDLVVRGRIVRASGGSQSGREWSGGFGGGAASFGVAGEFRRRDGTVLERFQDERRSGRGVSSIAVMDRCVDRVARDLTDQILAADWSRSP